MICSDVTVVIAALRPDHPHHVPALTALTWVRSAGTTLGVPDFVAASVLRLITNPRVFTDPDTPDEAVGRLERLLTPPGVLLTGSPAIWARLGALVTALEMRGNDIPDAALAAVCIENRAELLTFDRGFARFPGLRWRVPSA